MTAYICDAGGGQVSVYNTATYARIATVPVIAPVGGITVSPDGVYVWVTYTSYGQVSVIETWTNTVTASIAVGTNPSGVAITSDGAYAYVANNADGTVSVISTAANEVVATVAPFTDPVGVAVTPDGRSVYVTNPAVAVGQGGYIGVIATDTNEVSAVVEGQFTEPVGLAVTPDGAYVYATDSARNTVSVIDTTADAVVATIEVATNPYGVAVSPDGAYVYVACTGGALAPGIASQGGVKVIRTATNTVAATVSVNGGPNSVSVTPDGSQVWVVSACSEDVCWLSVIDTASYQVVQAIIVGANPYGVALGQFLAFPCAIQKLFEDDAAAADQLRRVRDQQLSAPAGRFLSEVLARHSADVVGLLADHAELRSESRELLLEAARVAQDGARFDDELIDRSDRFVSRVEGLVPASMSTIPGAMRTILESLRGRTLAAGIDKASETIGPRIPPPHPEDLT
jgi:YVTN family beta-propeller protein